MLFYLWYSYYYFVKQFMILWCSAKLIDVKWFSMPDVVVDLLEGRKEEEEEEESEEVRMQNFNHRKCINSRWIYSFPTGILKQIIICTVAGFCWTYLSSHQLVSVRENRTRKEKRTIVPVLTIICTIVWNSGENQIYYVSVYIKIDIELNFLQNGNHVYEL